MSRKKKAAKPENRKDDRKAGSSGSKKITLPAFGLAEEILEVRSENTPEIKKQASESAIRNLQSEIAAQDSGPELHLVTFSLDQEEYGVEIGSVQEIIRVGLITAVPNSPEFVKGVVNLRGRIIPVLNLRKRLGLSETGITKNSRIMVVESGSKVLGLLVDGVSQVLRVPSAAVDSPPGEVEQAGSFVQGIGKIDARLIMIMNLNRALARDAAWHPD